MSTQRRRRRVARLTPIILAILAATPGGGDGGSGTYANTLKWSEIVPAPVDGGTVAIPEDTHVILDVATPRLQLLSISGKLSEDPAALSLAVTSEYIEVMQTGVWEIGREGQRFLKPYTITLTGAKPAGTVATLTTTTSRAIHVKGGKLLFYGDVSRAHRSRLAADVAAGATVFMIDTASSNWKAGDDIVMSPTDVFGTAANRRTQRMTLASDASGFGITTTAGLQTAKFGRIQYVTDTGLSFAPGTLTPKAEWGSDPANFPPDQLDERAMVGNLSRNIVIQGEDGTPWTTDGWGVDVMVTGRADLMKDRVKLSGVRWRRCGKRGILGKYPIHFHMLSYSAYDAADPVNSGKDYYGAVQGCSVTDCVFEDSANRAVVVHGTNGITVARNVAYGIKGHAFFLENGSEMLNAIRDNLALMVDDPHPGVGSAASNLQFNPDGTRTAAGVRLAKHEADNQVTAYWITNPKNEVTGNWAADVYGFGIWFSFASKTFALSRNVRVPGTSSPMKPNVMNHGTIDSNYVQACYRVGGVTELPVQDEAGNVTNGGYTPKLGDVDGTTPGTYVVTNLHVYKCGQGNGTTTGSYLNRVFPAHYKRFVSADNQQLGIHGSAEGTVDAATIVGRTLNQPTVQNFAPRVGIATYHFSVGHRNCLFVNLPFSKDSPNKGDRDLGGGTISMGDLYLSAVEIGTVLCSGNKYVGSHAGYRCKPPWMKGQGSEFTFAGVMWDPHGMWGRPGSNMVFGDYAPQGAFFTYGLVDAVPTEPAADSGTVDTFTRFFGVQSFRTEQNPKKYLPYMPLQVDRLDSVASRNVVGQWFVKGQTGDMLPQMRHFAAADGGIYRWSYPYTNGTPVAPSLFHSFSILSNGMSGGSRILLGVPWQGSTAKVYQRAYFEIPTVAASSDPLETPYLNSYMTTTAIANGEARLADVAVSDLASVLDPVGNADCRKIFIEAATKTVWFVFKDNLAYNGPLTNDYPLGKNPTAFLAQYRMSTYCVVLP